MLHVNALSGKVIDDHSFVKTEKDLDAYCFASKKNYGPGIDKDMIEFFPKEWFQDDRVYGCFLKGLVSLQNQLREDYNDIYHIDIDQIHQEQDMTCSRVLALFSIYTFRQMSSQFYRELCVFLSFLVYHVNQTGRWNMFDDGKEPGSCEYADRIDAEILPRLINEFVVVKFKEYLGDDRLFASPQKMHFLSPVDISFNKIVTIAYFLCEWLYHFSFTSFAVSY